MGERTPALRSGRHPRRPLELSIAERPNCLAYLGAATNSAWPSILWTGSELTPTVLRLNRAANSWLA